MSQRRVLITGAGGFVGGTLALGFADLGWSVIGLDRAFDAGRDDHGVRWVTADLAQGVPPDVPGVDLVVHAAWVTTDAATLGITPADHVALNLRPLLTVLQYAARTGPGAFVYVEGLTETHRPTGGSPYAAAKRAGELLVTAALDPGTAVHVVRLGYLFGPGEVGRPSRSRVSLIAGWLAAAREGQALAVRSDDPKRDWTFTSDLAAALERVVDGPAAGRPVHLGSPHVYRDSALASLIASQVPGAETLTESAVGRVKPPMVPSDIPSLRGFRWTDPTAGVRALLAAEVAT
jgi:nucleoside-diphosphate-sugar epimerase